ncbi:MAG TPA: tRNA (N(6)-L-threonylcarbamoyladenosine(37)-C(2))-methylthiotransferase MtaB [Deltaproteobacteria bacterium]|nr:tRNA (N(6)-L-threonylcarbamoyladenosine(37)-C(2))-methylthiotransferase MtaB [Deltaproteobacteria bacterium]
MNSFYLFTTGCKANQWDSYLISQRLKQAGFTQASFAKADIFIVNGCTLTQRAERDIRRFIQRCRTEKPDSKIVLAGCHAQVYPDNNFGADLILGQQEKFEMASLIGQRGSMVTEGRSFSLEEWAQKGMGTGKTRFFFKIQDGCDRFCSYCIVPFARGKSRSRPAAAVLDGMAFLKGKGIKEVVLTGIDIASYRDGSSGLDLAGLIALLEREETPPRIRISSAEPMSLSERLIGTMAASDKIAPSIHIPLQSGCDRILKEMRRPYSSGQIRDVVRRLKEQIPTIGIGMDVMVGFPGESEEDFDDCYRFIESLDIYYLHVFPYSDRQGTKASGMEPKVPNSVKKERVSRMKRLDATKRAAFYQKFLGQRVWVIPEGKQCRENMMKGYSENYIPVYLSYDKTIENNIVDVTIRGLKNSLPFGER